MLRQLLRANCTGSKSKNFVVCIKKRLKEFDYDVEINESKFKESILNYFESSGLQEQSDGKNKILIFPEGIKSLLKNAFDVHDYQEEALLFARVAKICRNELFKEEMHHLRASLQAIVNN